MSKKFKRLIHQTMARTGVSHQGAVNILRRGVLKPLDAVQTADGKAGLVSAVLDGGDVVITAAQPVATPDGVVFDTRDAPNPVRFSRRDIGPYRYKSGERKARFVEELFDHVTEFEVQKFGGVVLESMFGPPAFIFEKDPERTALIVGEEGNGVLCVKQTRRVIAPLWHCQADLLIEGQAFGQDAVLITRILRERMVALLAAGLLGGDYGIVPSPTWFIDPTGDGQILSRLPNFDKPYVCGSGSAGIHLQSPAHYHGLMSINRSFGFTEGNKSVPREEPVPRPVERIYHTSVTHLLVAIQSFARNKRVEVMLADQPKESLLGFAVHHDEVEYLHLVPIAQAKKLPPSGLQKMVITLDGRRQIARWLQMGVDVLNPTELATAPLTF